MAVGGPLAGKGALFASLLIGGSVVSYASRELTANKKMPQELRSKDEILCHSKGIPTQLCPYYGKFLANPTSSLPDLADPFEQVTKYRKK